MVEKDSDVLKVTVNSKSEEYKLVKSYEFTSDRKMMSVVVKRNTDGKLFLFTKGADTSLLPLAKNADKIPGINKHIDYYSRLGYRILVFAMKELQNISEDDLSTKPLSDIEKDLTLLGVTAMEDLL